MVLFTLFHVSKVGLGRRAFERMLVLVTIQSGPIGQLAFWIDDGVGHDPKREPWMNILWKDDDAVTYSINPKWALDEYPFGRMMMLLTIP